MDTDSDRSTDLSLETEGAFLSEEEIRKLSHQNTEIDLPMPGEVVKHNHTSGMPEGELTIIDEEGRRVDE